LSPRPRRKLGDPGIITTTPGVGYPIAGGRTHLSNRG